jgi:hypothetical protein
MSLVHDEKVNRIYNHQCSVEERQPGKPVSEMGKIREKYWAEERKQGHRHDKEWDELKMKHQEIKNRNINHFRTDKLSSEEENKHQEEIKALREKHKQEDSDMKVRQKLEKERAIKAGHGAK